MPLDINHTRREQRARMRDNVARWMPTLPWYVTLMACDL